jgi:hypothetical protein
MLSIGIIEGVLEQSAVGEQRGGVGDAAEDLVLGHLEEGKLAGIKRISAMEVRG